MSVPTVVQFSTRKEGVLPLWDHCVEAPNVYTCPVERFLQVLSTQYAAPISERHPGLADTGEQVCRGVWGELPAPLSDHEWGPVHARSSKEGWP